MPREVIDLSGQRFGRLTVTGRTVNQNDRVMWLCRCDCGNDAVVSGHALRRGMTESCGCLSKQRAWSTDPVDLVGQRFGRLTVVARHRTNHQARWDCVCDCGNTKTVDHSRLVRGITKSCGCGMNQNLDIVGQHFGHYTVIDRYQANRSMKWVCLCDCGAVVDKNTWQLRKHPDDGHEGCRFGPEVFPPRQLGRPAKDLTGQTFGLLHVLRFDEEASDRQSHPRPVWACRCECGTVKSIWESSLLSGLVRTCGRYDCRRTLREREAAVLIFHSFLRTAAPPAGGGPPDEIQ